MATVQNKNELIQYNLQSVETQLFNFFGAGTETLRKDDIIHNIHPIVHFDVDNNRIVITMQIKTLIKATSALIVETELVFNYGIIDFSNYVTQDANGIWKFINERDKELIVLLIGISYSTSRGILLEKLKGSTLSNALLPIIDPHDFFKQQKKK